MFFFFCYLKALFLPYFFIGGSGLFYDIFLSPSRSDGSILLVRFFVRIFDTAFFGFVFFSWVWFYFYPSYFLVDELAFSSHLYDGVFLLDCAG